MGSTMSAETGPVDRNLLFGILALQMGCIDRDQFVEAMRVWVSDQAKPLEQILLDRGALTPEDHTLLDPLVARHLKKHDGDATRSLGVLSDVTPVWDALAMINAPEVQARVAPLASKTEPYGMEARAVDDATLVLDDFSRALRTEGVDAGGSHTAGRRFRVLRLHARGGLGQVYVARDEELGRQVALKEIQPQYERMPRLRSRFMLEAEINGNLEHPGIVPVYGLGTHEDGRPFYAMRFIQGDSLKDAIDAFHNEVPTLNAAAYNLRLRQLLSRFIDVCQAIAYAHSRGVIHRDLKPANVMLGKYGETLIIDWGLAKPQGQTDPDPDVPPSDEDPLSPRSASGFEATVAGNALGTPSFMSPEQAEGRLEELGPATDIYGLGAILYALLTGRAPVDGPDVDAILKAVRRGEIPDPRSLNPRVPPALAAICRKALVKRPEDRYRSAHALAEEIEQFQADEPVDAYRDPLSTRIWRWVRHHRTLAAGVVVAGLVGLIALTVIWRLQAMSAAEISLAHDEANERFDDSITFYENYFTGDNAEIFRAAKLPRPLLESLLESPRDYFERLTRELSRKSDPSEVELSLLARGRTSHGSILYQLGRYEEASQEYDKAADLYRRLIIDRPETIGYRQGLAESYSNLGSVLERVGQLDYARDSILEALTTYRALVEEQPADVEYREGLAESQNTFGNILIAVGDTQRAGEAYREAIALREAVVAERPDEPNDRAKLADSLSNYALVMGETGDSDGAIALFQKVVGLREEVVSERPDDPNALSQLALAWRNLGAQYDFVGHVDLSRDCNYRALSQYKELVAREPGVASYRVGLAEGHAMVAATLESDDPRDAIALFRQSIREYDVLLAQEPEVIEYRSAHARRYVDIGDALRGHGHYGSAIAEYEQAIREFQSLIADNPNQPDFRHLIGYTEDALGRSYVGQESFEEARIHFRAAIEFERGAVDGAAEVVLYRQSLSQYLQDLAHVLRDLGRIEEALETFRESIALDQGKDDPEGRYREACFLAGCLPMFAPDTPTTDREALAAEAVETLERAIASGSIDATRMADDPALEPLRDRSDFQRLLGRLFDAIVPDEPFAP